MSIFIQVPLLEDGEYATVNVNQIAAIVTNHDIKGSCTRIILATGSLHPAYIETRLTQKRLREMTAR